MNTKSITVVESIAVDRAFQSQTIELEGRTDYRLRRQCVVPRIESETDLQLLLDTGINTHSTYGLSIPVYKIHKLLHDRMVGSRQRGITTESVDQPFVNLMAHSLVVAEPDTAHLAYKPTHDEYLEFIRSIAGKLDFIDDMKKAFQGKHRNTAFYDQAWSNLVENDTEIVKLTEAFLMHQAGLQCRPQIGFTRMIEGHSVDSITQAATLNREANSMCTAHGWVKTLNLCIGPSALSRVSIMRQLISGVLEKGQFGTDFDFAYISLPNHNIRGSIAQWRSMEMLFEMIDTLKLHNIQVIMGNVDWAMAEVCMAKGIPYASSSISGKIDFARKGSGGAEKYGRMPLPDMYDWQSFYSFNDDFNEIYGRTYPYYSQSATQLNGKDLLTYKPKAMNLIRRLIYLEAINNQNSYRVSAAQKGELLEGTIKRLWGSSKPDYTKFLSPGLAIR